MTQKPAKTNMKICKKNSKKHFLKIQTKSSTTSPIEMKENFLEVGMKKVKEIKEDRTKMQPQNLDHCKNQRRDQNWPCYLCAAS